ncbi:MAG: hypothetical protein EAZ99_00855 [Alphaproteobacteria bacterium]|nr:hypothetical protein [Alphaproteobacteria bacterium]TAD91911.1 MAG: hypothetical protein EAZ99_00855 [Alphaproteobacteria bacterium]
MSRLPVPAPQTLPATVEGEVYDEETLYAEEAEAWEGEEEWDEAGYDEAGYEEAEYAEVAAAAPTPGYDDGTAPLGYADGGPAVVETQTPAPEPIDVPDYIQLVDRLTTLLWDEIDLIDAGDVAGIGGLQEEKERLSAAVRQTAMLIAHDPRVLDDGSEYAAEDLEDLKAAVTAMNDAAIANEQALRAALRSTDRLIRAVVRAVSDTRAEPEARYSAFGVTTQPKQTGSGAQKVNDVL